ncbi:hypothetical protein ABKN59_011339 [Abortiporus biennis]
MNLDEDSRTNSRLIDSSGNVVVFQKLYEGLGHRYPSKWWRIYLMKFDREYLKNFPPKWVQLIIDIQTIVISAFEGYFHRNDWLLQSISIAGDVVALLGTDLFQQFMKCLDAAIAELLRSYNQTISISDQSIETKYQLQDFLRHHSFVYSIEIMKNLSATQSPQTGVQSEIDPELNERIFVITDLPQGAVQSATNAAVEHFLDHNRWRFESELNSQWRIELRKRSPRLPPELWKLVIDFLSGDHERFDTIVPKTLTQCCLTCHEFLHWSRKHLYTNVQFMKHRELECFFASLSRSPDLQQFTTHIALYNKITLCTELFLRGQRFLPNLQTIFLFDMRSPLNPSLLNMRHPFPTVTRFEFEECTFLSILDLRKLVANFFPRIKHLALYNVRILSSRVLVPPQLPNRKQLSLSKLHFSRFRMDTRFPPEVYTWLSATQTPTTIQSLQIYADDIPEILPSWGSHLRFLHILFADEDELDIDDSISFGADVLPNLQTLVLVICMNQIKIYGFCDVLSKSTISNTLLCIRIWLYPDYVFLPEDLEILDDTLSHWIPHDHHVRSKSNMIIGENFQS